MESKRDFDRNSDFFPRVCCVVTTKWGKGGGVPSVCVAKLAGMPVSESCLTAMNIRRANVSRLQHKANITLNSPSALLI